MIQNLGSNKAEYKMLKSSLRIFILAWRTIVLISCDPMKIRGLLVLPLLSLSLLLLMFVSQGIWPMAQIAHADLSSYDNGRMHTTAKFYDLLGLTNGNVLNLQNLLEHKIEIDAKQIFPNETLKREIISKAGSSEFTMPYLKYNLLGFNISATDIKVRANTTQLNDESDQNKKTRIDFPVMLARNVNVSNNVINQSYHNVDLSSIYAIYDPKTDKFTFHVPFNIAAKYLKGS
jgi:hypothetical protein